jgi:hypothetical protein
MWNVAIMKIQDLREIVLGIRGKNGRLKKVAVHVPCYWDPEIEEWILTKTAHKIIDETKMILS